MLVGDVGYCSNCRCAPALVTGSGVALSKTGAADPGLVALDDAFEARCESAACGGDNPCVCDAYPGEVSCDDHRCKASTRSCLPPLPADAGS